MDVEVVKPAGTNLDINAYPLVEGEYLNNFKF